jgi:hypothetical protein
MTEANPFTDPRDANLAAAWEYGSKIGKRRERILLTVFLFAAVVFALATCAQAPVSFAATISKPDSYNLIVRFNGVPGYWRYEREFKNYADCYSFATGRIIEDDIAMILAANPTATVRRACGIEVE